MKIFRLNSVKIALAVVLAATAAGTIYTLSRTHSIPTTDEFFRRNPHLTRPTLSVQPDPGPKRSGDAFLPGDYHLLEGKAYPIALTQNATMRAADRDLADVGYQGRVDLHSLGMLDQRLTLIADFHIEKWKGNVKLTPKLQAELGMKNLAKNGENQLRVVMDPSGKIQEVWAVSGNQGDESLEMRVNALAGLFRRLPPIQAGTVTRTEGDDRGTPFPIEYRIASAGGNLWKIEGEAKHLQALAATPAKAAAGGAPELALLGLADEQRQGFVWVWDNQLGLPQSQRADAFAAMSQFGRALSSSTAKTSANWESAQASKFTRADEKRFASSVAFRRFLSIGGDRLREITRASKKDGIGKDWSAFTNLSEKLADPKMSVEQKEELFVDYARTLRSDPSRIGEVRDLGMRGAPGSRETSMALGALGFEGSPEAQAAMLEIYARPQATVDEKLKVLNELTLSPGALSAPTKQFLTTTYRGADPLTSDLAASAGLAIGASISKDGDGAMVSVLHDDWNDATGIFVPANETENRQTFLLTAMGNSKSDVFLDEVKSAATASSEQIRSSAVNSVRFAQDSVSRGILAKALSSDPVVDVRVTAAQSMRYQPFDTQTRDSLTRCTENPELGVRIECYRVLTERMDQPGVRDFLQSRVGGETDPQVRGLLNGALAEKDPNTAR